MIISIKGKNISTVFLLDVSESISSFKDSGENFINSALEIMPKGNKAGEKIVVKSSDYESEINVTYPNGEIKGIKSGDEVHGEKALGIYKLEQNDNKESFSVNFPTSSESNTSVAAVGENENIVNGENSLKSGIKLTPLFILLSIIIVAIEWIFYKKGN